MEATTYKVVSLADGLSEYKELAKAYWNWIQGPDPDANPKHPSDPNLTFLRDDVIGSQLQHEVGILLDVVRVRLHLFLQRPLLQPLQ